MALDIDFEKVSEKLSQENIKSRAHSASGFYKGWFKKVLDEMILDQLEYLGLKADEEEFLFCRGTLNGLKLIKEWFAEQEGIEVDEKQKTKGEAKSPLDNI